MFGYVKTDDPYLYKKDDVLYKSLYCGVCKAIGSSCGQMARFALTYDVAFLSAVAHNIMNVDVTIKQKRCIAHPIIRRPIAEKDDLTFFLAHINTLLAYYKVCDDVYDNGKGRFKRLFLKKGYKRSKKACPEIEKIIRSRYEELTALEKKGVESVDMVSDPFASMLAEISDLTFEEFATENTNRLFYALGKWIYLIDALDDYDKDIKKGNYNVFRVAYKQPSAKDLLVNCGEELQFIFMSIFADLDNNFKQIKFYFNKDLVENILQNGVRKTFAKTVKRILNGP